jgi:LPXTG-motif cell wall-anchored protein
MVPAGTPTPRRRNYHGPDGSTYRLVGARAPDYIGIVAIDVTFVPDPFQLSNDTGAVVNDGSSMRIDVLGNDSGDDLTIVSVTQGQLGIVETDGSAVIYTPGRGATGSDIFDDVATDGTTQATAAVTVTVTAPTTRPVPVADTTTRLPTGEFPRTGGDISGVAGLAAGAIMLGAPFALIGRRRPS